MSKYNLPSQSFLPIYFLVICAILLVFGIVIISENLFIGIGIVVFSLFVILLREGYQFDKDNHRYRSYMSFLGLKWGKWRSLKPFSCIVILHKRMGSVVYGGRTIMAARSSENYSYVSLAADNHITKDTVYMSRIAGRAKVNAQRLSEAIDLPIKPYNPKKIKRKTRPYSTSSKSSK